MLLGTCIVPVITATEMLNDDVVDDDNDDNDEHVTK